jgi:hypothetical protein
MGNKSPLSFAVFRRPLPWPRAAPRAQLIRFGEGWVVEHGLMLHKCGTDVRSRLGRNAAACTCGVVVPRRVRLFRSWFLRQRLDPAPLTARSESVD